MGKVTTIELSVELANAILHAAGQIVSLLRADGYHEYPESLEEAIERLRDAVRDANNTNARIAYIEDEIRNAIRFGDEKSAPLVAERIYDNIA